ncbi:MAG: hypothetical protein JXR77_16210 [Lentisphaeria bacterium]|nr:hypothetical protein [Lentisphaeria bacterium]
METPYRRYWGDSHHNTYQHCRQDPPLDRVLEFAGRHLDFYTGAYYTAMFTEHGLLGDAGTGAARPSVGHAYEASEAGAQAWQGVRVEALKPPPVLRREWAEFQDITRRLNAPGRFVVFPGYEWQGNARWGDHNVILRHEGPDICTAPTLAGLYAAIRGLEALAIPHHTAYLPGMRAPRWEACDPALSPFTEIFSVHGCSETDEERPGLRRNPHMGPGTAGGTYRDALLRGLRLGCVCSTDNWTNMPGHWGHGLMACLARDLTRDALWEAFRARRVYGVTGDRIELDVTCNGAPMGSVLEAHGPRRLRIRLRGVDALDRIEVLRNERVWYTHNHQDTWTMPAPGSRTSYRMRLEVGWGPLLGELPAAERSWRGRVRVEGGRFQGWSPCWTARGQEVPVLSGEVCELAMVTPQGTAGQVTQQAVVLDFEAAPEARLEITVNGATATGAVAEFAAGSRILWYPGETARVVRDLTGFDAASDPRGDMLYHQSPKVKLHQAIPEPGTRLALDLEDDEPVGAGVTYRVRAEQRNGQRAWSSPIWVAP